MSDREKFMWATVLISVWASSLMIYIAATFAPGPNARPGLITVSWLTIIFTVAYLLVMSWRAFYVTGKKARRG